MDCCSTTLVIRGAGTGRGVEEHRCQLANPPSTEGPQQHRDPARSSRNRRGSTRERPRRPETRGARAGSDVVRCRRRPMSTSCLCLMFLRSSSPVLAYGKEDRHPVQNDHRRFDGQRTRCVPPGAYSERRTHAPQVGKRQRIVCRWLENRSPVPFRIEQSLSLT